MIQPVRRELLRDATTQRLRELIMRGTWPEHLPSEAVLCRELHVSRITLRPALAQLVREKLLRRRGSGRPPIITTRARAAHKPVSKTTIHYLSPRPAEMNDRASQVVENTLREYVGQEGFKVEYDCLPDLYRRFSARRMAAFTADHPDTAAWVLFHTTPRMQAWFAASGLPCVVTGTCYEGVDLPSVEFDFFESCYHAFHLLAGRGGGHVVFVVPPLIYAGMQLAVRGFLAGAARCPDTKASLAHHDGSPKSIRDALETVLKRTPRPTGYLVMLPEHTLTTLGFLHSKGIRIPEEASVICRTNDLYLDYCVPTVACYRLDCIKFGKASGVLLVELIRDKAYRQRHLKIVPDFVPGQTFRPTE